MRTATDDVFSSNRAQWDASRHRHGMSVDCWNSRCRLTSGTETDSSQWSMHKERCPSTSITRPCPPVLEASESRSIVSFSGLLPSDIVVGEDFFSICCSGGNPVATIYLHGSVGSVPLVLFGQFKLSGAVNKVISLVDICLQYCST